MGKSLLVFGSTCVDVIIRVDHLPRTEENLHPKSQHFSVGGCAYNVANILGRGGADAVFVTPVGMKGVFGPYVLPVLNEQPWSRPVPLADRENGCCYCLVESGGERTFLSIHGAEYSFSPEWMVSLNGRHFDYGYICGLEVEEESGEALVSWLETADIGTLMYAPGPRGIHVPQARSNRMLDLHPLLHLNQAEALQLSGKTSLPEAMDFLWQRTENAVIVTRGSNGAAIQLNGSDRIFIPGMPAPRVVDTIGAGDAHAGAVLLALSRGQSLPEAAAFANQVAARVVAQAGATLERDDLLRF